MPGSRTPIPESFASAEEAAEFWDCHSTADYDDLMEDVEMELSPVLRSRLERKKAYRLFGFSTEQINKIEALAKSENTDGLRLMSGWILQHI
ncbi:MAG: hypothetical protein HC897_09240 [Thermoanaerobaculia bacterium]|nr:hypothetical protein [Thermoanaerobaculia bacterium]